MSSSEYTTIHLFSSQREPKDSSPVFHSPHRVPNLKERYSSAKFCECNRIVASLHPHDWRLRLWEGENANWLQLQLRAMLQIHYPPYRPLRNPRGPSREADQEQEYTYVLTSPWWGRSMLYL
jgi:hypothetical protein